MKVLRVFNNNVVMADDTQRGTVVVTGRGVGFSRKPGDAVDLNKVVQIFVAIIMKDIFNFIFRVIVNVDECVGNCKHIKNGYLSGGSSSGHSYGTWSQAARSLHALQSMRDQLAKL